MARPQHKNLPRAINMYKGGASMSDIARTCDIHIQYLSRYFKQNGIKRGSGIFVNAMGETTNPYQCLLDEIKPIKKPKPRELMIIQDTISSSLETETRERTIAILETLAPKNIEIAKNIQNTCNSALEKCKMLLENDSDLKSIDLLNITKAIQAINSTLAIIPQAPTIAQQFNFNNNAKDKQQDAPAPLDININFKDSDSNNE